jgi:hypothetical protein
MSLVKIVRSRLRRSVALMAVTGGLAWTHHYLVASYDFTRTVTVEGEVAQFLFRKPHSFLRLETRKEQGGPQMWLAEWGDGSQLSRAGVFADTLRPGDRVVVAGNPARDATEHKLRVVTIRRLSDGWNWTAATD